MTATYLPIRERRRYANATDQSSDTEESGPP